MVFVSHLAAAVLMGPAKGTPAPVRFTQGSLQSTGRPLDLALQGPGYFMLGYARKPSYTRNGAFALDEKGRLVSRTFGKPVLGWQGGVLRPLVFRLRSQGGAAKNPSGGYADFSVSKDGDVSGCDREGVTFFLGTIAVAGFKTVPTPRFHLMGEFLATPRSGRGVPGKAEFGGLGSIESGFLEGF